MLATRTLGMMGEKVTLEQIAASINHLTTRMDIAAAAVDGLSARLDDLTAKTAASFEDLASIIKAGFEYSEKRFAALVWDLHKDMENLHEELHGIHKVIGNLNRRLVRVEATLGFLNLPEPDPRFSLF